MRAQEMYTFSIVSKVLQNVKVMLENKFLERAKERFGRILAVCLWQHWKKVIRRNGKSIDSIHRNFIRKNISVLAVVTHDIQVQRAKNVIKPFMMDLLQIEKIIFKGRQFCKYIIYIQNKLRLQLETRFFKVEVL
jgi:hypothetical protein